MFTMRFSLPVHLPRTCLIALLLVLLSFAVQPIQPAYTQATTWPDCTPGTGDLTAIGLYDDASGQAECESLRSIYETFNGDLWDLGAQGSGTRPWGGLTHVGTWYGVFHSDPYGGVGYVTGLVMDNNNLNGDIGAVDLTGLPNLWQLNLGGNPIWGNIEELDINNKPSLSSITLGHSQIGGNIDGWNLSGLPDLHILNLYDANIGGDIAGFDLSGVPNVDIVNLRYNQIGGDPSGLIIPADVGYLRMDNNQLNGTAPDVRGTGVSSGNLFLCPNPAINPSGNPAIDNLAEARDNTGWTAAAGCPPEDLSVTAACVGANLYVDIANGDVPLNITGSSGPGLPQNNVDTGVTILIGPDTWTDVTVSELSRDLESINLGDFTCTPVDVVATVVCNGADIRVAITAGDPNFILTATDPGGTTVTQHNHPLGAFDFTTLAGSGTWTNISVTELTGDTQTLNLADVTCHLPTPGDWSNGGGNTGAEPTLIPPSRCALTTSVSADRSAVAPGDQVVWTISVQNLAPADCHGVQTSGTMPGEFSITNISTTQGSVSWFGGPDFIIDLGTILANGQATVTLDSILQIGAGFVLPEGAAALSAGQQICLTGLVQDPVGAGEPATYCVTLFPDSLPSTGGEPVSPAKNWGWLAAAGLLIAGLGGYTVRRRRSA